MRSSRTIWSSLSRSKVATGQSTFGATFAAGVGQSLIAEGLQLDAATLTLPDKRRRRVATGLVQAVIGFQYGRCLICDDPLVRDDRVALDRASRSR